jgi:hypothetical protein
MILREIASRVLVPILSPITQAIRGDVVVLGERAVVSGKRLLTSGGAPLTLRGTNQGNWGQNYQPDAALIAATGAIVVRTVIRWQGAYPAGVDCYSSSSANDFCDPAHRAQFYLELDWLEAQGLWIELAFDSDYGAGNRGLGTSDWNFFDTLDTAGKAQYLAEFKQFQRSIIRDCLSRDRILSYELLPEPLTVGANAGHGPVLKAFYLDMMTNARTVDATTPFLIGGRGSYAITTVGEVYFNDRTDVIYTVDMLTAKVQDEAGIAADVEATALFRDTNNVPVLVNQVGRNTSEDEGNGTTSDNLGLTALNGVLSILNAYGLYYTHWQFHQNTTSPTSYGLYYQTVGGVDSADNWTPKVAEIAAFTYHMGQTGAAIEAAAVAAATACGDELYYVKGDLSNVFQTNDTSTPCTTVGQTVGRINKVVGSASTNMNQATAGLRPLLAASINGYAMQFDASDDWLQLDVTYFASGDPCTIIAAGRAPTSAAQRVIFHVGTSASTVRNPFLAVIATDEFAVSWRGDDNTLRQCLSATLGDNRAFVCGGRKVGSSKKGYVQGVMEGTEDANAVGSMASITRARFGATTSGTNPFGGPLCMLFLCKTTVTDEQYRAISRWGAWMAGAPFRGAIPA